MKSDAVPGDPGRSQTPVATRGSLDLLNIPAIFTQDDLLDTQQFIDRAKDRGLSISLDVLQDLHASSVLFPLYRVSDITVEGRRIGGRPRILSINPYGWVWEAASEGRLRDPYHEGYSSAWPYHRPSREDPREWWNGFVYSSWQLIDLPRALDLLDLVQILGRRENHRRLAIRRSMTLALAGLSVKHLPTVLGRMSIPTGMNESDVWRVRSEASASELIAHAGLVPHALRTCAEELLGRAHMYDPMIKWLPIMRHATFDAWKKLRDQPLACMWYRIAAEVLLLAHDELAEEGHLEPLPDLSGASRWTPLHDRLTLKHAEADTLERSLGDFGLSPHPKVLVLVEGKTELNHVPRLLAEIGLTQPQQVRVQSCDSSQVNPHLIARYNITPRVGRRLGDRWLLNATGTALVIVMDPENRWATAEQRRDERATLMEAIRKEVRGQGAEIPDNYLDHLVTVRVWGDDKYELANFTDDELVAAITQLAGLSSTSRQLWEDELRARLTEARHHHHDIKIPLGRMRIRVDKPRLADLLWPALRAKLEREFAIDETPPTPVIGLVADILRIHQSMSGIRAMKAPESNSRTDDGRR